MKIQAKIFPREIHSCQLKRRVKKKKWNDFEKEIQKVEEKKEEVKLTHYPLSIAAVVTVINNKS